MQFLAGKTNQKSQKNTKNASRFLFFMGLSQGRKILLSSNFCDF
jgi:hypothetical protein